MIIHGMQLEQQIDFKFTPNLRYSKVLYEINDVFNNKMPGSFSDCNPLLPSERISRPENLILLAVGSESKRHCQNFTRFFIQ